MSSAKIEVVDEKTILEIGASTQIVVESTGTILQAGDGGVLRLERPNVEVLSIGSQGLKGIDGTDGTDGTGVPAGTWAKFKWSTDGTVSDPGSGYVKANGDASIWSVSKEDFDGNDISLILSTWGVGSITLTSATDPTIFAIANVQNVTDQTGYVRLATTLLHIVGSFTQDEAVFLAFTAKGDTGATGATGAPGQDGEDVDLNYVHIQNSPSAHWTVNHNLHKFPSVTVVDSALTTVIGQVSFVDSDNIVIDFSGAFSGKAYIN